MGSLAGKAALVIGGSRGIGAAIARALAAEGADVAITYSASQAQADSLVGELLSQGRSALAIAADALDAARVSAAVDETVAAFGRLDILVNNAGNFATGSIEQLTLEDFDRALSINLRAVFAALSQALKYLPDGGRVISIGSSMASRVGRPGISLYATAKTALIGLTKGVARDLGPRRITVNLIQPGPTDTDMNPADGPRAPAALTAMALPDFGQPEDIAATVVHLAGEGGRHITGAVIDIDGGVNA